MEAVTGIYLCLPGVGVRCFAIGLADSNGQCWHWNGNRHRPSLIPSLNVPGRWHGYLTNGELVEVGQ